METIKQASLRLCDSVSVFRSAAGTLACFFDAWDLVDAHPIIRSYTMDAGRCPCLRRLTEARASSCSKSSSFFEAKKTLGTLHLLRHLLGPSQHARTWFPRRSALPPALRPTRSFRGQATDDTGAHRRLGAAPVGRERGHRRRRTKTNC